MSLGTLTRRIIELGASPAVVEAVVEYVTRTSADGRVTSADASADKRREADRIRQAARRKTLKEQREHAGVQANDGAAVVTSPSADASADVTPPASNLSSFLPSVSEEETTEEGRKKRGVSARARNGTRMVVGTPLTDEFRAAAVMLGAAPDRVPGMWAEFVDFWVAVPGLRGLKTEPIGWLATWRNRVRKLLEQGQANGHRAGNNRTAGAAGSRETGTDAVLAGVARAADRRARQSATAPSGDAELPDGGNAAEGDDARLL